MTYMCDNTSTREIHESRVYLAPLGAGDITVTSGVGAWVVGSNSGTILTTTGEIIIVELYLDPGNDQYDIEVLNSGTSEIYCAAHSSGTAANTPTQVSRVSSPPIPSGVTLVARAYSAGGSSNIGIKIGYVFTM